MSSVRRVVASGLAMFLAGIACAAFGQDVTVPLSGANEIPPVTTSASGTGFIAVAADRSVTVRVSINGMTPTVAHIHEAAAGSNGAIIVPLVKGADGVWTTPPGTKLTDAQFAAFKAGNLYFNIHSEAFRSGEIRGQIKP
jgi:hypothetical protein